MEKNRYLPTYAGANVGHPALLRSVRGLNAHSALSAHTSPRATGLHFQSSDATGQSTGEML